MCIVYHTYNVKGSSLSQDKIPNVRSSKTTVLYIHVWTYMWVCICIEWLCNIECLGSEEVTDFVPAARYL